MPALFAGWSPIGIAALFAIGAGIVMLAVYAVARGFLRGELDGTDGGGEPEAEDAGIGTGAAPGPPARSSRVLGMAAAAVLVAGLVLGVVSAVGGWGQAATAGGPGGAPADCAQGWDGCPKDTPQP